MRRRVLLFAFACKLKRVALSDEERERERERERESTQSIRSSLIALASTPSARVCSFA